MEAKTATAAPTTDAPPAAAATASLPAQPAAPKAALVNGGKVAAIVPQDFESAYRLATVVVKSGMAPKSLDTIEKATVAIMHGLEVGFTPMAALQSIAVVNGMPTIFGDGMLALVRASGLLEDIIETVEDDKDGPTIAVCKVKRAGSTSWTVQAFTRPQAMKAGLWKKQGPWTQYPQRMMQMRARSWALRDAFADVLRGLTSAEEAADMVDVTSRGSATTTAPEPRRSDYVHADTSEPAVEDDQRGGGVTDHDPDTGVLTETRKPWKLDASIVGQEPRRKAILDLLELAKVKVDVDEIQAEHQDFLDKLGRVKAETMRQFEVRRGELPEQIAPE